MGPLGIFVAMKNVWKKYSAAEIKDRVFSALKENVNFFDENIVGVPASHLDSKVFFSDASFLKDAPFLSSLIHNPNHIGCHTLGHSESFFSGTQAIEKEVIEICAKSILKGEGEFDGYIASGGTEANLQACWMYRNYFVKEHGASLNEISILCSSDSHYSMAKAANVLGIGITKAGVEENTRLISKESVDKAIKEAQSNGAKYFITVANMMTTMFGSVDPVDVYTDTLESAGVEYMLHVDGAYGGFFFPFSSDTIDLDFRNPKVNSVTLDAHKMVQAPYGTGIFLVRKGFMQYANTSEASYVEGEDSTLIGSRSGANAIAIWMILSTYGPHGWWEKIQVLLMRSKWLEEQLLAKGIEFYKNPASNILTLRAKHVSEEIARKYVLVPDNHRSPKWYKIVVMEHVSLERLIPLVEELGC